MPIKIQIVKKGVKKKRKKTKIPLIKTTPKSKVKQVLTSRRKLIAERILANPKASAIEKARAKKILLS